VKTKKSHLVFIDWPLSQIIFNSIIGLKIGFCEGKLIGISKG